MDKRLYHHIDIVIGFHIVETNKTYQVSVMLSTKCQSQLLTRQILFVVQIIRWFQVGVQVTDLLLGQRRIQNVLCSRHVYISGWINHSWRKANTLMSSREGSSTWYPSGKMQTYFPSLDPFQHHCLGYVCYLERMQIDKYMMILVDAVEIGMG